MPTRGFELSTPVPTSPRKTIDFLTDLTRHRGLHPYLVSADVIESGLGPDDPWQDWRVVEQPRLGPLRTFAVLPEELGRGR